MGILGILALIFGITSVVASTGIGIYQGISNAKAVEDTNATNYKIAQETNQSNVEQAEMAYRRSLPYAQVNNLMSAGMSKQGALSALTGGGTYNAPTLQSSQMQAPLKDFGGAMSALERLQTIPANVEQADLIQSQRNALEQDTQIKMNQDQRAQEMHDFDKWKQGYDKNTALALDSGSSKVANALIDSGKTIEDFKDFEDMLRGLGLDKDSDIRNLNYVARQQLEDGVRSKFDAERARQEQENKNLAAKDAHDLNAVQKDLSNFDLDEKQKTQITRLAILANQLEDSNLILDEKNKNKLVREAGFENEKEAYAALTAAQNLENKARMDKARFNSQRSDSTAAHVGYALEWVVDKVSPFKGILSGK